MEIIKQLLNLNRLVNRCGSPTDVSTMTSTNQSLLKNNFRKYILLLGTEMNQTVDFAISC